MMRFSGTVAQFGLAAALAVIASPGTPALAQDKGDAAAPAGILPIPDYGGNVWERSNLTGDWGGLRTDWAQKGIQFEIDGVAWLDTVVNGGKSNDAEFGGNLQYDLDIDLMRAGILPGAVIQVRAESRFGTSGILNTGQIVPNNTAALSPTNYSDFDEGYDIALTQLSYSQFFSEHFGVIVGKLDMYGKGSPNEFMGGRGRTQFMNWNLNFATPALFVPASTIGAGAIILPNENLTLTSLVVRGTDCTRSNCFDDLDDSGVVSVTTASYQYTIGDLPGGVNGMAAFFFDGNFTDINSIAIGLNDGVVGLTGSEKSSSWFTNINFWQYLSVEQASEGPVNLLDGVPDHKGWGVFGSLSFADPDTNPWKTSISFGIGGRGVIPGRPNDLFGIGGFYNDLASVRILQAIGFREDYAGMEAFYNFAITPAMGLSANIQYLPSVEPNVDDSTMISGRLRTVF